jgi:hypothetical protein
MPSFDLPEWRKYVAAEENVKTRGEEKLLESFFFRLYRPYILLNEKYFLRFGLHADSAVPFRKIATADD